MDGGADCESDGVPLFPSDIDARTAATMVSKVQVPLSRIRCARTRRNREGEAPTETTQGDPPYRADASWWLPLPLRRALLFVPPFALAVLEIFHPQPDVTVQALLDASTWFAGFHIIQLVLTGWLP